MKTEISCNVPMELLKLLKGAGCCYEEVQRPGTNDVSVFKRPFLAAQVTKGQIKLQQIKWRHGGRMWFEPERNLITRQVQGIFEFFNI
ncbi:unnamed protein product [Pleuronectes platessa]|uniref:Uncharacterized protein n=1 Tax=Pleuronectes platessa TaxID=8262 RepID=A0A9N7YBJ6_PLEPL|nr:unnamed protein product [Pleuronectes platessa]